ncbi:MFS transporter [Jatrophihabitans sp. YIM 134969]
MPRTTSRLIALLVGSSLGAVGWGAVLPYLYADVADARGFGATAAAVTFTAFALGALVASPIAGRLADRANPVLVATLARLLLVLTILAIMLGQSELAVWSAAFGYGVALALNQPSVQVMVLALTPAVRRRDAFAWQFIGQNLGLALGGFAGGFLVDLTTPTGSRPVYVVAAAASLLSAAVVYLSVRGIPFATSVASEVAEKVGYRQVFRAPGVRWLLAVTVLLTLACYAQFDSGLPAYALSVLDVPPTLLGTAVAVNAILVAALTAPVVALTRRFHPGTLLAACAVIWAGVWVLLGLPLLDHAWAPALVVVGYATFAFGETVLAPVLTPLAATLAPEGAAGRTLAAMNGAQTLATAVGPGLSGVLLAAGVPVGFVALQLLCCAVSVVGARRLRRATAHVKAEVALAA